MAAMDEKIPGSAPTPGWFATMLNSLKSAAPGGGAAAPKQGIVSPGIQGMGMPQAAPPVVAPQGGQAPRIPQLPQINQTAASSKGPLPIPQIGGGQTEFRTKGGRDAAIISGAVNNITESVQRFKMKQFQSEAAHAEQIWTNYTDMQSAIQNEQDPQKKQRLQQAAQQLLQDKKNVKILEKAQKDPMSGAGVGMQRAIQGSSQRAMMQAQLEHVYAQMNAENMRAQQEQATGNLRNVQASQEGQVTPKARFDRETELLKFQQQQQVKGYNMEVRGMSPAVKGPDGKSWSWDDLQDQTRRSQVPPDAAKMLLAERASKQQEIAEINQRQQLSFAQQMKAMQTQLDNIPRAGAAKLYNDQQQNTLYNDMRYARMQHNAELALRGDQQAMNSLLSDHVAMTLRQPGNNQQRPTLEQWKEAEQSRDLAAGLSSKVDFRDGKMSLKQGVTLTPEQIEQMVGLGTNQHKLDWVTLDTAYQNAGIDTKKVPYPVTLPGLEVIPRGTKVEGSTTPTKSVGGSNSNPLNLP